ncbi:MAG: tRNA preQ1(34) S-adenosylmethionine ribosyltransferase-isomerase QueA [Chloroflexota bacterium]|nr:tRNA preQ1(34) S-adenosylmethionine ribosyltransferase-isomerase QueA [Chloroflexota bacterium]
MNTADFDYDLPPEFIAQTPVEPRDHSRLMVLERADGSMAHRRFHDIVDCLGEGDVLVFNDSRVIPARLMGRKAGTGGRVELLLLRRVEPGLWETLVRPGRRVGPGTAIEVSADDGSVGVCGEIVETKVRGIRVVRFADEAALEALGQVPLPPYIHAPVADPERYQTVYARVKGSVAAPTAGLHFTPELLHRLAGKGVQFAFITLHVGLDTFLPVRVEDPRQHPMHSEYCEVREEVARELSRAKQEGRRVVCVGTTVVRALEHAAIGGRGVEAFRGWTDILILPGHRFQSVDALITNFHLPRSTLLMLVSAFAGRELVLRAYCEAMRQGYRFYSFGDAMLVV